MQCKRNLPDDEQRVRAGDPLQVWSTDNRCDSSATAAGRWTDAIQREAYAASARPRRTRGPPSPCNHHDRRSGAMSAPSAG